MTAPSPEQIRAVVHRQLRAHGAYVPGQAGLACAIVAAVGELYPAASLPGPTRALRVGRDDVVALTVHGRTHSAAELDALHARMREAFPGHRVAVVEAGELTVLRQSPAGAGQNLDTSIPNRTET
ncbi:hypothetical protein GCM10027258_62740 [Amycolatopsis stemonae]